MTAAVAAVVAERVLVAVDRRNTTVGMAAGLAVGVIAWENTIQLGDIYLAQYPPACVDELSVFVRRYPPGR